MSGCGECKGCVKGKESGVKNADYTIALAGNANVGKSVIFNQLTGVDQIIGNWPGKTVERAEGLLLYSGKGYGLSICPASTPFPRTRWRNWSRGILSRSNIRTR